MRKIKKYSNFINEMSDFSISDLVLDNIKDDYIKNIVTRYTKDIDPQIDIWNAVNLLDTKTQKEIEGQIKRYLDSGIIEKEPEIITSTDTEPLTESEVVSNSGKGVFTSFLKTLTALGQKENKPSWETTPDNFLIYYNFSNLMAADVKIIFSRFKSLGRYIELIKYDQNECGLYFGVRVDGIFEYGFSYSDGLKTIGQFKISKSSIKWLLSLESKSAQSIKKELVNLSFYDILVLGQIKSDMQNYNPGYFENKINPQVTDRVISFGYQGVGKWDNGKLDEGELMNIKNNFTNFLLQKKWGSKVLISVKGNSYWLYFHIKLK